MSFAAIAAATEPLILGDKSANLACIYLCGLTQNNDDPDEIENRELLDRLGKKIHLKIIALHPFDRCEPAGNKLCWLHYTSDQALQTYDKIRTATSQYSIRGYLGFSNGGFYLNQLAQLIELGAPIISVGSAGTFSSGEKNNNITLIVGQKEHVYNDAVDFFRKTTRSKLNVTLVEHHGDHILPEAQLEEALLKLTHP